MTNDPQPPADASRNLTEALCMLDVFASVGAESFDLTHTNISGEKRGFRRAQTLYQLKTSMPYLLPAALRRQNNVIVRPQAKEVRLIQLDDLTSENMAKIAPEAFLALQTSPRGSQAWVAVKNAPTGFLARLKGGLGADQTASGATRVAGTTNFKPAYAPDFPVVHILDSHPGRVVTPDALEAMGIVLPARPLSVPLQPAPMMVPRTSKWPDYQRCLDGAPLSANGHPKRTSADFVWCKIALSWGHSIEATAGRLLEISSKAQENGEGYALQTATHADHAARLRNVQPRQPRPR